MRQGSFRPFRPHVTCLEDRNLPSDIVGYVPSEIRKAYTIDQVMGANHRLDTGSGETIAIVDWGAYSGNLANSGKAALADLHVFDRHFGLGDPTLAVVSYGGQPRFNPDSSLEQALDLQWAHAIAPGARILLVEAANASLDTMLEAVAFAARQSGVVVVSMNWGTPEFLGTSTMDTLGLFQPAKHPNVAFVAASGDDGMTVDYPAVSPNVLCVGGTTLSMGQSRHRTYFLESAWDDGGGGPSTDFVGRRTPDVSYDADPATGVAVYDRFYKEQGQAPGWVCVGGTSAGTIQWAALIALADTTRAQQGKTPLTVAQMRSYFTQMARQPAYIHATASATIRDVTRGNNGYAAGPGYDYATGFGTPLANRLIPALAALGSKIVTHPGAGPIPRHPLGLTVTPPLEVYAQGEIVHPPIVVSA